MKMGAPLQQNNYNHWSSYGYMPTPRGSPVKELLARSSIKMLKFFRKFFRKNSLLVKKSKWERLTILFFKKSIICRISSEIVEGREENKS